MTQGAGTVKGPSENFSIPLKLQAGAIPAKSMDLASLWEKWSEDGSAVFLESAGPLGEANQWLILAGAPEIEFYEHQGNAWIKDSAGTRPAGFDLWEFLDRIGSVQTPCSSFSSCLPLAWFGTLSYDFGKRNSLKKSHLENLEMDDVKPVPDFYFFKPSRLITYNRKTKEAFVGGLEIPGEIKSADPPKAPFEARNLKCLTNFSQYESKVKRAQEYIAKGDIYQANLAQCFQAEWKGSAANLYRLLRELNPGPFMGLFKNEEFTVVSSSPERLVAGRGDWLETRPIAGTRPRGKDGEEDLRWRVELKTNLKEQAEHLMLVDLARNDLGRVSRYGTVEVERYAEIEPYAHVQHLVSTVRSQKKRSATIAEVLKSLFPGGTITGCPKTRCMEIIQELEGRPRGFYTGSMGYVAPGPCFDFNILIRSFTLFPNGLLEFQAGAGIVADSDPEREYLETLYKVEALAQALGISLVHNP
jgi:anthranilate/para-aminobenzoate synthase component I